MTTTKSIELNATVVATKVLAGLTEINRSREQAQAAIRQEWADRENRWREAWPFNLFLKPHTEDNWFSGAEYSVCDEYSYASAGFRHSKAEIILNELHSAATLSIAYGDGMMWLDAEECSILNRWGNVDVPEHINVD
jgi:hypothetical protein